VEHTDQRQRVPAQRFKTIQYANLAAPQQLAPDRSDPLFATVSWRDESGIAVRVVDWSNSQAFSEADPLQLPGWPLGDLIDAANDSRHFKIGQSFGGPILQRARVEIRPRDEFDRGPDLFP